MQPYDHVCESCGKGHESDSDAEAQACPNCGSEEIQASRANH